MSALRLAYLGPEGTFTEAALRTLPEAADAEAVACASVPHAVEALRSGQVDGAVVPFENSVEGSVSSTLDELAAQPGVQITREVLLPVSFALLARPGTTLADVQTVGTHPHAEAQVRRWLHATLPSARVVLTPSTADAARGVRDGVHDAAVSAPIAAERYGLVPLAEDVHDTDGAVTRFVLVRPPGPLPAPTGADRTTLVAFIAENRPGALLELLTEFAVRGVNLSRIESRPTGEGLGSYCFSIDCEGHVVEARMGEALKALHRTCLDVRFLGSYPRADRVAADVRHGTTDADFAEAGAWLEKIRGT